VGFVEFIKANKNVVKLTKPCILMIICLVVLGCTQVILPDKEIDEKAPEDSEFRAEVMAGLLPTSFNMVVSPAGDCLVFHVAGAPVSPFFVIDLNTGEYEQFSYPEPRLADPGRVNFSSDGKRLVYSVFLQEEQEGLICFSHVGDPSDIYQTLPLPKEELLGDARPVWNADQSAIYYITATGLWVYRFDEGKSRQLYSTSEIPGLIAEMKELAPLTYSIQPGEEKLAYFHEGVIRVVMLGDELGTLIEIPVKSTVSGMEISQDGKYLLFDGGSWDYGLDLSVVRLADGYIEEVANRVCSYAWGPGGEFAILAGQPRKVVVYDSDFQTKHMIKALSDSQRLLWVGDTLALLTGGDQTYPLYALSFD
jgi:hypothetical protein